GVTGPENGAADDASAKNQAIAADTSALYLGRCTKTARPSFSGKLHKIAVSTPPAHWRNPAHADVVLRFVVEAVHSLAERRTPPLRVPPWANTETHGLFRQTEPLLTSSPVQATSAYHNVINS
ncbi:hypothetical protein ACCS93_39515, partial [Rhizobium ruizarguesonis]